MCDPIFKILMRVCVHKAWESQTLALPNPSVACMVLDAHWNILALQAHLKANTPHAEVLALREAFDRLSPVPFPKEIDMHDREQTYHFLAQHHQGLFKDCTLLVTLEPCNHFGKTPPCARLLSTIRPRRVVVGCLEKNTRAMGGVACLREAGVEVMTDVLDQECQILLRPFKCLQQKGAFNLFKIAMRLDGSYEGKISGQQSQVFTHNQRGVANCLITSGQSVREDRPILDQRFAHALYQDRLCDVAILTQGKRPLDPNIALFSVPGRKVQVCQCVQDLPLKQGFNLIEGGWGLAESLQEHIDMLLIHSNASLRPVQTGIKHCLSRDFKPCFAQILDQDILTWQL